MSRYVCVEGTSPIPVLITPSDIPSIRDRSLTVVFGGSIATITFGVARAGAAKTQSNVPAANTAATNLRLVAGRTFVKFTFFKVDPAWRRRSPEERAADKAEFQAACEDFAEDRSLRAYSTVGTRGDTDLLLLSQSPILEDIHTFHVVLGQSGLARWAATPYSYLAMTKPSPYSESESRPEICTSERKYLFVYPFEKKREWYALPMEERQRIMANHIEVGRRYPEISINTAYSFGLDDQEFVVSFEGDDPGEFLDLVQELRGTESSSYTLRDTPIFTCVAMSLGRALDALDGTAAPAVTPA
jgi:chlorite dismutase